MTFIHLHAWVYTIINLLNYINNFVPINISIWKIPNFSMSENQVHTITETQTSGNLHLHIRSLLIIKPKMDVKLWTTLGDAFLLWVEESRWCLCTYGKIAIKWIMVNVGHPFLMRDSQYEKEWYCILVFVNRGLLSLIP